MKKEDDNAIIISPSFGIIEGRGALIYESSGKEVFREDSDTVPTVINDRHSYMPWGADNQMPYTILDMIERDETLSTCQMFNAEICYGNGLRFDTSKCSEIVREEVDAFCSDNNIPAYFLGVCQDLKHFAFTVSVVILSKDGKKIVDIIRKEACYCRFSPREKGKRQFVYYGNWRESLSEKDIEVIPLLDVHNPLRNLKDLVGRTNERKFAILTEIPAPDHTYYPIPYYASLFRGKWYDIKQLIGLAKEAKLKNSAPIKYLIEISKSYWTEIFKSEHITDPVKQQERVKQGKQEILDFLTGVENSGKAWFSTFYRDVKGQEYSDVKITKVETDKEGGDWSTDIIEAINMICFTMRVHSNLVGSVSGKTQSNNSGSDKRELYTIAQALQKPYHDLLFAVYNLIIRFNGWKGCSVDVPFIQLSTLDENRDAKLVTTKDNSDDNND